MQNKEFQELGAYMKWAMFTDTDCDYDEWVLDVAAPNVPDGTYPVSATPSVMPPATAEGVVVKDGRFDIVPTMKAVETAIRTSLLNAGWTQDMETDFDWVYIEALDYDPEQQQFTAALGS